MKIITAIDSFKGSLTSIEAGNAAAEGIRRVYPEAEVIVRPLADGGEGTAEALAMGIGGELREVTVHDSLMRPVKCKYYKSAKSAVVEMAVAAGLPQLAKGERNPMKTTTYGVGEIIADALSLGCRDFIIGIGGSSTNDGGTGMLTALGYGFYKHDGTPIALGGEGLSELAIIDDSNMLPALKESRFRVACDVTNPLCGELGCSRIYAPQKGANNEMIEKMDSWLSSFARLTKEKYKGADPDFPGSGAAGGMGFAFREFLGGELVSGINLVLDITRLESYIAEADAVITGEGRLDSQSAMGKAPVGVASLAAKYQKPCIAFAGSVTRDAGVCNSKGITAFFPIRRSITTLEEALDKENARHDLADTAEQVFRLIKFYGQI